MHDPVVGDQAGRFEQVEDAGRTCILLHVGAGTRQSLARALLPTSNARCLNDNDAAAVPPSHSLNSA
jgi:hypothetical protein